MKIALFGHFGAFNFGNESTLTAMLSQLRAQRPDATVSCICSFPETVTAEYGIPAIPVSGILVPPLKSKNPLIRFIRSAIIGVPSELYRWHKAAYILRDTNMLIIVGTGLLNNAFGLAGWGPYSVFKWTAMARLRGCKVCFVSIGAGPLNGVVSRFLARAALSMATFRSYRDEATRRYLQSIGFYSPQDQVYPDLAFSLPASMLPNGDKAIRSRRVVGIGVMSYDGIYGDELMTPAHYAQYKRTLLEFCEWLLLHEYDIHLLIGDLADTPVLEEINSALQSRCGALTPGRVLATPARSAAELLAQLGTTDFVVATRFHNVLLGLFLRKPSISISFHSKCSSLMEEMGLSEYCQDIQRLSVDKLIAQFCSMEQNAPSLKRTLSVKVEENREALNEQYRRIIEPLAGKRSLVASLPSAAVRQVQSPRAE